MSSLTIPLWALAAAWLLSGLVGAYMHWNSMKHEGTLPLDGFIDRFMMCYMIVAGPLAITTAILHEEFGDI